MAKSLTTPSFDQVYELNWLKKNSQFEQRPATILEFLDVGYLDVAARIRTSIKECLVDLFGEETSGDHITEVARGILTGAIGIGKTTIASVILSYLSHYVLCMEDPQEYYNLLPGSRIAFMQMSTSETQAKEVVFGDIKARIKHSRWFQNFPYDPIFKNQLRFPKEIWILPGDSHETTFEGYNILGGILDEADSHIVTATKDYAQIGYETIANRVDSRFGDKGFVLVIGQMKSGDGFAHRMFEEFSDRDDAYAKRMTIWESYGLKHEQYQCKKVGPHPENEALAVGATCGEYHTFPYDTKRKQVITEQLATVLGSSDTIIRIPTLYKREFDSAPEKALKDLAGIPPAVGDPFISMPHKIEEAIDRWQQRYGPVSPVSPEGILDRDFMATDSIPRVGHIDIAYSAKGDSLGFAMGHVQGVEEVGGELKPYIVIDLCYRVKAPAGGEVYL